MQTFVGKTVYPKIAIGKIFFYRKEVIFVNHKKINDPQSEFEKFHLACKKAKADLALLYEKTVCKYGISSAEIIEMQMMMLDDNDYIKSVINIIRTQNVNIEYAIAASGDIFTKMFAEMDDEYMNARTEDVKFITERLLKLLSGKESDIIELTEPVILVAEDLSPAEIVGLDKENLLGLVTHLGSVNSHTAILAKNMSVPAMIGVDIKSDWDGKTAILNGYNGMLIIDPDEESLAKAIGIQGKDQKKIELLKMMKGQPTVTRDGISIKLYANIDSVAETALALQNDAEGIGLFRSEYLYLEANDYPSEDEQFIAYKSIAENMGGKNVIIRTLDIGADKQVDYFGLEKEKNPAMGFRAIRICLTRKAIFKTQLRAILRAGPYGDISVMFPMIISLEELNEAKSLLSEASEELKLQGISFKMPPIGVMIETPAAVMISRELADEVSFFSIGTNDLSQYILAIDRQNSQLDHFYNAHHPAILRMIQMTVENGRSGGCRVGICGELANDLDLIPTLLKMGIDELSVAPSYILPVREKIRSLNLNN